MSDSDKPSSPPPGPQSAGSGPAAPSDAEGPGSAPPPDQTGHLPEVDAAQLRTMYELAPIPAFVWRRVGGDFVLLGFNRAGAEMTFGYCHRFLGRTAAEMYADVPAIRENLGRCFETREHIQHELVYPFRTDPGQKLDLLATYAFVPPDMVTVFALDITQRTAAEREARQSRERYRRLYDNALVALGRSRIEDGTLIEGNRQTARLFGYDSMQDLLAAGTKVRYVDPELRARVLEKLREDGEIHNFEAEYLRHDGTTVWVRASLRMVPEEGYIEAVAYDITDWKRAEAQRELLATAVEVASESIVITDPDGVIEYANPAFARVTGWDPAEVTGQREDDLLDSGRSPTDYATIREQLRTGKSWRGRLVNKRRDGLLIEEDASFNPVLDAAGRPTRFVSVKRDVTNEVRLERQLEQARKMEAIGRLAGGIAHDFNNLLTAILGHTELSLARTDPEQPIHEDLLAVRDAGERAARLTRQLLEFGRPQPVRPRPIDLNDMLLGMEKMLRTMSGAAIALELDLTGERSVIRADASQIERVVMNLVGNSVDAMPDGGRLLVCTERRRLETATTTAHADLPPGEYLCLLVRDDGVGMASEVAEQMFEPFFTTKAPGEGTGLGLATVHGVVRQLGGGLVVESRPGAGTTVTVWLPVAGSAAEQADTTSETTTSPYAGTERVLAVEDDAAVRRLISVSLGEAGYRLTVVPDAESALELAASGDHRFDLLLTDLRLPGIDGRSLAAELRRLLPDLPVVCVSGYAEEAFHTDGPDPHTRFLAKPFTPRSLLQTVRQLLDTIGATTHRGAPDNNTE